MKGSQRKYRFTMLNCAHCASKKWLSFELLRSQAGDFKWLRKCRENCIEEPYLYFLRISHLRTWYSCHSLRLLLLLLTERGKLLQSAILFVPSCFWNIGRDRIKKLSNWKLKNMKNFHQLIYSFKVSLNSQLCSK